jgi:two-component system response regulator WspF
VKVGIVNDQRVVTEALCRIVLSDARHQVLWTAADGRMAVEKCQQDPPDVILMDLVMPVMNGAEATREIMRKSPCPLLIVTATVSGNYALVCEALGYGAYDAVCTPSIGDRPPREAGAQLLAKLNSVDAIRQSASRSSLEPMWSAANAAADRVLRRERRPLVAIGASTGGPQALEKIISAWPADFPAAVLIAQHIAKDFATSLAKWLQERSKLPVRTVAGGEFPQPGTILVAATNDHLVLEADGRLAYREEPGQLPYRPSVDVLFDSLAKHWPTPSVAAVLTGIGRDGAEGLLKLRQHGWHTIAEDKSTCIVYGMPQAAAELGAAKRILPLPEIAAHVASHLARFV